MSLMYKESLSSMVIKRDKSLMLIVPKLKIGKDFHIQKPTQFDKPEDFPETRILGREISEDYVNMLENINITLVESGRRNFIVSNSLVSKESYQIIKYGELNIEEIKNISKICDNSWRL